MGNEMLGPDRSAFAPRHGHCPRIISLSKKGSHSPLSTNFDPKTKRTKDLSVCYFGSV